MGASLDGRSPVSCSFGPLTPANTHLRCLQIPIVDDEADSAKKPDKMAIGGEGGFQVDKPKHTIEKEFALVVMPDRTTVPLPCPELPTIVLDAITAIQVSGCLHARLAPAAALVAQHVVSACWRAEHHQKLSSRTCSRVCCSCTLSCLHLPPHPPPHLHTRRQLLSRPLHPTTCPPTSSAPYDPC
jgi:hypothetical protein